MEKNVGKKEVQIIEKTEMRKLRSKGVTLRDKVKHCFMQRPIHPSFGWVKIVVD